MVRTCCAVGCKVRSHDRQGNKVENGLSFHSFPTWNSLPSPNICWCSRHFHSVKLVEVCQWFKTNDTRGYKTGCKCINSVTA
uniref:THAP-type domain-containing protein n=1 Tax=Neolamprologus brichardi TaxID=32507 RepID=A0A3Q4GLM7_NEOBR